MAGISNKYVAIWLFLLFVTQEGFGMRQVNWGGLGNNFGWFAVLQLVSLACGLMAIMRGGYFWNKFPVKSGLHWIFVLYALYFIHALLFNVLHWRNIPKIIHSLAELKSLFMIPLIAYLTRTELHVRSLLSAVMIAGMISASVSLLAAFNYFDSLVIVRSYSRGFRMLLPTGVLMLMSAFLGLYFFLKGRGVFLIVFLVCLLGTLSQMHRSVLLGVGVSIIMIILYLGRYYVERVMGLLIFVLALCSFFWNDITDGLNIYSNILSLSDEFQIGNGNVGVRMRLITQSFHYIVGHGYLGVGYLWEEIDSLSSYLNGKFYLTPTKDNSLANIIIVYGFPGIFVFGYVLLQTLIRKRNRDGLLRKILFIVCIYTIIVSTASATILLTSGSFMFYTIVILLNNSFHDSFKVRRRYR